MAFFKPRSYRSAIKFTTLYMVAGKALGYLGKLLTAYYFGISRGMDIYFMAFGISQLATIPFKAWFDQLVTPRLVQTQEADGDQGFRELSASVFSFSLVLAAGLSVAYVLLLPVAIAVMAHGFSPTEKIELRRMSLYFVPLILISFPFWALGAILKGRRYYDPVQMGEVGVSAVATAILFFWHPAPTVLPLTIAAGYLCTFAWLMIYTSRFTGFRGGILTKRMRSLYRNFLEFFGAKQVGSLGSVIDRFLQSYLSGGSISALSYASQTLLNIGDVLNFKELYIVPLSSHENRIEKLQRLLEVGLFLTIPLAVLLSSESRNIVHLLFQRGQFNAGASALTATVFAILAPTLVSAAAGLPLFHMFQILDKVRYSGLIYLVTAASLGTLGGLLVCKLHLDLIGLSCAIVTTSFVSVGVEYWLIARMGVVLDLGRLLRRCAYALIAALSAVALSRLCPAFALPLLTLVCRSAIFFAVVGGFYFFIRKTILETLWGKRA